ncbi:MAG TPA: hypothetical protein VEC01_05225 [Noviherbaspirillum sp.]|uniref:LuxE/PaaK family acyltransferase n=1 Tax=Noviherbaspirillum sp. TaxID=1926288 RepID=UPI002D61CF49|nr:hypothetical protein [Noviherbaspirillum sp.]HYD94707.1 hypothetical protein [Noviherbaspirillum sp.]
MAPPLDEGRQERLRLAERIQSMFAAGVDGDPAPFDRLALDIFAHQYRHNLPYRAYCDALQRTPEKVGRWQDIPAFPTDSFKTELVTSFPFDEAVMANLTSGTTAIVRGQIFRDEIGRELVLEANRIMTGAWLFPDFAKGERCRVLILAPSPEMAPSMGMATGMDETRKLFGTPDSRFLLSHGGIDVAALVDALAQSEASGVPVAMIGSTSAFVFFFNACRKRGVSFHLPAGSRIGDGGGYRGRFGELTQEDYLRLAYEVLGIPATHCVNVLGMAESATGYFDNTLRHAVKGLAPAKRMRQNPPWARTVAVSLDTLAPLPPGEVGLLRHYDAANLPTVLAVQTDNLGVCDEAGNFQIVGRAQRDAAGKVSAMPSERTVGPMGDKRIFRMLEAYVNFSIRFKSGLLKPRTPMVPPACPCGELADAAIEETTEDALTAAMAKRP